MASFADQMATFTDHLRSSIRDRGESLVRVHEATGSLLADARTFMKDVTDKHQSMAQELTATLAAHRADRVEKVGAMRHEHQESLQQMRHDMRTMLDEANTARFEAVAQLRNEAQQARAALSDDLRRASQAWHAFAASRSAACPAEAESAAKDGESPARPSRRSGKKHQHHTK
jgi:hypothetical protein